MRERLRERGVRGGGGMAEKAGGTEETGKCKTFSLEPAL